jgi:pimeloyl-ACP methyl ester carboxylesterase
MRFLLVHGGCHGAWCWDCVLLHLPARTIDLPGHGQRVAPAGLTEGVDAICRILSEEAAPVTLVGHSLGGMAISGAGEAMPEKVARLIYLSALLPCDGESAATIPVPPLGATTATRLSDDGEWTVVDPETAVPVFYQDCDAATAEHALRRIGPTHLDCIVTPVRLTAGRFGRSRKSYVHCLQDRAIEPAAQMAMIRRYPDIGFSALDSGHSPFLSMPAELAALLRLLGGN